MTSQRNKNLVLQSALWRIKNSPLVSLFLEQVIRVAEGVPAFSQARTQYCYSARTDRPTHLLTRAR